jgi:hypothetical protein
MRLEGFSMATSKTGKRIGRPPGDTLYPNSDKIKAQIVGWLSEGKTLRDFCRQEQMPSYPSIFRWLDEDPVFAINYARAREVGFEILAEEALYIADNTNAGRKVVTHSTDDEDVTVVTEEDMLGHRKLQIDTRMRLLRAWHPKKYGDKTIVAGDEESPLSVEVSFDVFGELLKNISLTRAAGE